MADSPLRPRDECDWYERLVALADRYEAELRSPPWYTMRQYYANYVFCNSKCMKNIIGYGGAVLVTTLGALCMTLTVLVASRDRVLAASILGPTGGTALLTLIIVWCRYRRWSLRDALQEFMHSYAPHIWVSLHRAGAFTREEDRRELNAILHLYFWNLTLQEINEWYKYVRLRYNYPVAVDHILIRQYV